MTRCSEHLGIRDEFSFDSSFDALFARIEEDLTPPGKLYRQPNVIQEIIHPGRTTVGVKLNPLIEAETDSQRDSWKAITFDSMAEVTDEPRSLKMDSNKKAKTNTPNNNPWYLKYSKVNRA